MLLDKFDNFENTNIQILPIIMQVENHIGGFDLDLFLGVWGWFGTILERFFNEQEGILVVFMQFSVF